jgi:hypothetical protein
MRCRLMSQPVASPRYRVEWRVLGAWVPTDAFDDYEAADTWAVTLLAAEESDPERGVRVVDSQRARACADAVVWSVER